MSNSNVQTRRRRFKTRSDGGVQDKSQKLNDGRSLKKCSLFFLHGQKVAGEGFRRRRWMRNDRDSGQRRKQLGAKRREQWIEYESGVFFRCSDNGGRKMGLNDATKGEKVDGAARPVLKLKWECKVSSVDSGDKYKGIRASQIKVYKFRNLEIYIAHFLG
jgi:hypothetical protein